MWSGLCKGWRAEDGAEHDRSLGWGIAVEVGRARDEASGCLGCIMLGLLAWVGVGNSY